MDRSCWLAHFAKMIGSLLWVLALAATAPSEPQNGARIEARATATIVRAVTLRDLQSATNPHLRALERPARPCAEATVPDCRLIVYDLP